jgi:hypothetical protein
LRGSGIAFPLPEKDTVTVLLPSVTVFCSDVQLPYARENYQSHQKEIGQTEASSDKRAPTPMKNINVGAKI